MKQKDVFLDGEGDAWYQRNIRHFNEVLSGVITDPVFDAIRHMEIHPSSVLEIGCSTGYRLFLLWKKYGCICKGVDPSRKAIAEGKKTCCKNIELSVGTADKLSFLDGSFDMVIFGFCLYLCDREDLFKIVYEADRVLKSGGRLVIYDFYSKKEYSNMYQHCQGLKSFKMDYKELFLAFPCYSLEFFRRYGNAPDDWTMVCVLLKG